MRDRRNRQQKRRDEQRDENGKSIYEKVMSGEIEPQGSQKGWKNLQPVPVNTRPKEEQRAICRKGAEAVNRLHGEQKTAKESLDRMLSILATEEIISNSDIDNALAERLRRENPNMTLYDAVNAAAIGRALSGNARAMEYIRETRGDAPIKQIEISDATTDADRKLMQQLLDRMQAVDVVQVVDIEPAADLGTGKDDNT